MTVDDGQVRTFDTGATRDTSQDKLDFDGFLSPAVVKRYAEYMHAHRYQKDGTLRDSANWQKGMPFEAYMKSGWRHFFDWWALHHSAEVYVGGYEDEWYDQAEESLCALLFNIQGYLFELLRERRRLPRPTDQRVGGNALKDDLDEYVRQRGIAWGESYEGPGLHKRFT